MDDGGRVGIDAMRGVVVGAGPQRGAGGIVARFPGVVCVAALPAGGSAAESVRTLLDLCTDAAGDAPGRPLGRRLARWLAGPDAPQDLVFGTVAAAGDRLAVFLSGAVTARLPGGTGSAELLSGLDAVAWTDRLVPPVDPARLDHPAPDAGIVLALDAGADGVAGHRDGRPLDLRSGVVPGSGLVLVPAGVTVTGPARVADAADGQGAGDAGARAAMAVPAAAVPDPAAPDPGAPDPGEAATEHSREPLARGFVCARGHLNDPRSHFCVLCGIRMNESTGVLTTGPRPPLGLLVFDDGATFTVDAEYVVGRSPETDPRVRADELRALIVEDRGGTVSRVHAEVRIRDWDVLLVDVGSRNGTFVVPPGAAAWERAPARTPLRLEPGTRVRLGHHRTFVFESPSGVR